MEFQAKEVGAFYDNVYYFSEILHTFLSQKPNLLYNLDDLASEDVVLTQDVLILLRNRFKKWLAHHECIIDPSHQEMLEDVVETFAELAAIEEVDKFIAYA